MTPPTRREALKLGAGAAAALCAPTLLAFCGQAPAAATAPDGTSPDIPCDPGESARVVAVRGNDLAAMTRSVLEGLGGIASVVKAGESVFVKPNMVTLPWSSATNNPFRKGECTKVEVVVAVVEECLKAGAKQVTVGDGSQMPRFDWAGAVTLDRSTNLLAEATRLTARYGRPVKLACLDTDTPEWVEVPTATSLGSVVVSSLVTEADRVISVPVAKTHKWAHLTLSIKNFIGITPLARYGWSSTGELTRWHLHRNDGTARGFGRLSVDLAQAAQPDLAVIDMSIGIEADGPDLSTGGRTADMAARKGSWLVLASTDCAAADATAARVLKLETPYVAQILGLAHEAGLGTICAAAIEVVGPSLQELRVDWTPARVALP